MFPEAWVPTIITAIIGGTFLLIQLWYKTRAQAPQATAATATSLTEGASRLVEKYEQLLERMEIELAQASKEVEALEGRVDCLEKDNKRLVGRVRKLEKQIKDLGETPANGGDK